MSGTVWASGCSSWYLDADGDPLTWPDTWKAWLHEMQQPIMTDFYQQEPAPEKTLVEGELEEMA
jgi:hypothetical protein